MLNRTIGPLLSLFLIAAACGDDDASSPPAPTSTAAPQTTTVAPQTTTTTIQAPTTAAPEPAPPAMGPAEIRFEAQSSDGSSIVVASVALPSPGFIAVHSNADGGPGPVIGHSGLLPAGTSTNVEIVLDAPLAESDLVFPMAHIDVDEDGEYEFFPPDNAVDGPAQTAEGGVAVVGAEVTVQEPSAAPPVITIKGFDFGPPIAVVIGETITVRNEDGAAHTWTSVDGAFDSGTLGGGEEFSFTFEAAGEYAFLCEIHPSMTGSISVSG